MPIPSEKRIHRSSSRKPQHALKRTSGPDVLQNSSFSTTREGKGGTFPAGSVLMQRLEVKCKAVLAFRNLSDGGSMTFQRKHSASKVGGQAVRESPFRHRTEEDALWVVFLFFPRREIPLTVRRSLGMNNELLQQQLLLLLLQRLIIHAKRTLELSVGRPSKECFSGLKS